MASFNNSVRPEYLLMWMYGIWTMAFLHHFGVSVLMYKNRNQNASNFIKIIFNLMGMGRGLIAFSLALVPDDTTETSCQALSYIGNFVTGFFRMSLSVFLLWRIKQIEFKRSDMYIGFTLFAVSSGLQLGRGFIYPLHSLFNPVTNIHYCGNQVQPTSFTPLYYSSVGFDFAIDLFVTFRLVQILRRANKNAHFVTSNMQKPFKRTLFTSVMYWNFLRLGLSLLYQVITVTSYRFNSIQQVYVFPAAYTVVYVALAYVITADAEIVKVIEGRTPGNVSGSTETDKTPLKRFGFRRGPTSTTTKGSTEYIISTPSLNLTPIQQKEKIDTNNEVASSIKRLSFFEWAKFVVGKKEKNEINNSGGEQGSMEEIDEKFQNNAPGHGITIQEETRRESDHSLATTVIDSMTLPSKENHDSMV